MNRLLQRSGRSDRRTKVLFLLAYPRSGSTILGNVIGSMEGFLHIGEVHFLWDKSLLWGRQNPGLLPVPARRCGCGEPVETCSFWTEVLSSLFADSIQTALEDTSDGPTLPGESELQQVISSRESLSHRSVNSLVRHHLKGRLADRVGKYARIVEQIYESARRASGASIIVDTSKFPRDAAILESMPSISPFYVHLVRDPRATLASRLRKTSRRHPAGLRPRRTLLVLESVRWSRATRETAFLGRLVGPDRFMVLRYEDFVQRPQDALRAIAAHAGEVREHFPISRGRTVQLKPSHCIAGNRVRFHTGEVELREDLRWENLMGPAERATVRALTGRLMSRYGY